MRSSEPKQRSSEQKDQASEARHGVTRWAGRLGVLFTHLFTHGPQLPGRGRTEQHYLDGSPNRVSAGQSRFGWSGAIFVKGHLSDF
jgi:hypothetical protein